ncbi:MAG: N-acetylglucosamine-6-phosphate deacetylase [Acidimicrobiales bacterium]
MTRLGVAAALVNGQRVQGDVDVGADGRVAAVGVTPPARAGLAAPGFVDLQVNGFFGVDFLAADPDGYERAGRALAATGVTAYQPTFVTSPVEVYEAALATAAALPSTPGGPRVLGVHLEGPFLAPSRRGAHNADLLLPPDPALLRRLLAAGPVAYVTLAPELPGALALIADMVALGIVVSLGHSDADAAAAHAGFDAGATTVTHLFNAMPAFGHRTPGLAGAALARPDVVVQAIVDHVHLAPEATQVAWAAARGRFALVTDAIEAAGLLSGRHRLGDRKVTVADGEVRLDDGTLAGSVLTMDRAVRNLAGLGVPVDEALVAASEVPAGVLRRVDLGRLTPQAAADIVVLDDALAPVRTVVGGIEVFSR